MQPVRHPGLHDSHVPVRAYLGAKAAGGVRRLRRRGDQILLAGVEQQLALEHQVAVVVLRIVHVGLRLAIEELAVEIEPGRYVGREQTFAISAVAA